jgi:hypothetical protein
MSDYKINGEDFVLQPTLGRWVPRETLGISGNGHAIYPQVREFELTWNLDSPSGTYQLQKWFDAVLATGTAVLTLPKYGDAAYVFFSYTGCYLREPEWGAYFSENITNVVMRVTNIRT